MPWLITSSGGAWGAPEVVLTTPEWKAFCHFEKRSDLQAPALQADERRCAAKNLFMDRTLLHYI
jgi:hypothetical protein